jgi:hypothetical protein
MNSLLSTTPGPSIDELEAALFASGEERVNFPIVHRFTPGLYIREITMPAGALLTSMEHLTEHPFVISKGAVEVIDTHGNSVLLTAPHTGITLPGTRRALHCLEETIWTTFHVTEETDVEKIIESITRHNNPLAPGIPQGWRLSIPENLPP